MEGATEAHNDQEGRMTDKIIKTTEEWWAEICAEQQAEIDRLREEIERLEEEIKQWSSGAKT